MVVNVTSMDDQAIGESEKILIQVGTVYRSTGWRESATTFSPREGSDPIEGYRIESLGEMPWKAAKTLVKVDIKNTKVQSAWVLNSAGYEARETPVIPTADGLSLWVPMNAMYVILDTRTPSVVTGLSEDVIDKIEVFPNPNNGTFKVRNIDQTAGKEFRELIVTDIRGKPVKRFQYAKNEIYSLSVPAGVYFIRLVTTDGELITKKLVMK